MGSQAGNGGLDLVFWDGVQTWQSWYSSYGEVLSLGTEDQWTKPSAEIQGKYGDTISISPSFYPSLPGIAPPRVW